MIIKNLIDEDFTNYKKCSLFIGFPTCTFKCEKECGCTGMCQNCELVKSADIEITVASIVDRYVRNPLSQAIVCGGLEPFDSFEELLHLLAEFRSRTDDDFVIFTGYTKDEIKDMIYKTYWSGGVINYSVWERLTSFPNVIIKFGRYVPNKESHYDEVLGITLVSDNQYAEKIS